MRLLRYCFCAFALASTVKAADPALLERVPAGSGVLIGVNIDRISSTRIGQAIYSQMQVQSRDFTGIAGNAEFELVRGIREILIAGPAGNQQNRAVMLIRGTFTPAGLKALAAGTAESSFQGIRIFTGQQRQQPFSVAILDDGLLLGGSPQAVRSAVARRGLPGSPDPVLTARAREMNESYDVWFVARTSLAELARQAPQPQFGALAGSLEKSIQQIGVGLKFGPTLQLAVDVVARTDKDAVAVENAIRMLIGLALSGKNAQEIKPVLDKLQFRVEANTVKLDLEIPEDHVMAAMEKVSAGRARAAAGSTEVVIQGSDPANTGVTIQSSPRDMGVVTLPAPKPQ
jgi:hypothetical protein